MQPIDSLSPGKSFGLGLLLATLNTKNLPIAIGVSAAILQAELSGGSDLVVVVIYTAVVAVGVAGPLLVHSPDE